jgi:hypothetical protein
VSPSVVTSTAPSHGSKRPSRSPFSSSSSANNSPAILFTEESPATSRRRGSAPSRDRATPSPASSSFSNSLKNLPATSWCNQNQQPSQQFASPPYTWHNLDRLSSTPRCPQVAAARTAIACMQQRRSGHARSRLDDRNIFLQTFSVSVQGAHLGHLHSPSVSHRSDSHAIERNLEGVILAGSHEFG